MRHWGTLAPLCVCFAAAFGKSKHAPLPDELVSAKTVYLVNNTGYQQALDTAYGEFQKWGRFTLVSNREGADVVVVFGRDTVTHGVVTMGVTRMDVFLKGGEQPAFEATEAARGRTAIGSVKECIKDFRNRLDAK